VKKPFRYVRPGSLAVIGALVAAFMMLAALLEIRNTRDSLLALMAEKGSLAAGQIEQGAVLAMRAMDEAESNLASRLLTVARTTKRLESLITLNQEYLAGLARENGVQAIHVVSQDGRIEASSQPASHFADRSPPDFRSAFPSLFSAEERESVLGMHLSSADGTARFAVGVRRNEGGIVVCSIDADKLLELRKTFGLGRLIQDVGKVHGVRYVMIQDEEGIVSASSNVSGARKILSDPFLADIWHKGGEAKRNLSFQGQKVFEVVRRTMIGGNRPGLLRVAFDLHELEALEQKSRQRLWTTVLLLAVLGIVALNAVVIYQNMKLVVQARDQVTTFSTAVLSGMADGVLVVSEGGKMSLANDAARGMFGNQRDRMPREIRSVADDALRNGAPAVRQLVMGDGEESQRVLTLSASRISMPGEEAPSAVLILRDVTEEQRLRESIQRSEKITAMGRLAAAVAHEVRNPLNAIGMSAQRLRAEFEPREDTEEYRRFLDVIRSEIGRLDGIIAQFLQFASEPRIETRSEDVAGLTASVVTQVRGYAAGRGVRIASEVPEGLTAILDARQMRQVLLNLVANAVDSIQGNGEVRISAAQKDSWIEIAVEDDGSGMTEKELEQAFELHFTTKEKGTGLGLPISQKIIERHGGVLILESRKGKGTRAAVRIPRERVERVPAG